MSVRTRPSAGAPEPTIVTLAIDGTIIKSRKSTRPSSSWLPVREEVIVGASSQYSGIHAGIKHWGIGGVWPGPISSWSSRARTDGRKSEISGAYISRIVEEIISSASSCSIPIVEVTAVGSGVTGHIVGAATIALGGTHWIIIKSFHKISVRKEIFFTASDGIKIRVRNFFTRWWAIRTRTVAEDGAGAAIPVANGMINIFEIINHPTFLIDHTLDFIDLVIPGISDINDGGRQIESGGITGSESTAIGAGKAIREIGIGGTADRDTALAGIKVGNLHMRIDGGVGYVDSAVNHCDIVGGAAGFGGQNTGNFGGRND